ncbi:MAG: Ig domain-containing protein [Bacteroidota bacterium]
MNISTSLKFISHLCLVAALTLAIVRSEVSAQSIELSKEFQHAMEISDVISMESSPAHMYVLSEKEGLVVFRTNSDTLQWLYSSPDMQKRGHNIQADIRFAYMYGNNNQLTVVEPTSVLGVYSSTHLPATPYDLTRIDMHLYLALGDLGLGHLSLETPESVDTTVTYPVNDLLPQSTSIIQTESTPSQLFALTDDHQLFLFNYQNGELNLQQQIALDQPLDRLFIDQQQLLGSTQQGDIFEIRGNGKLVRLTSIDGPVEKLERWRSNFIIQDTKGMIWLHPLSQNKRAIVWAAESAAENLFTVSKNYFWVHQYNQLFPVIESDSSQTIQESASHSLRLSSISNQTIPYPRPLLLPIRFEEEVSLNQIKLTYRGRPQNAQIRGQSFYWQPDAQQIGNHRFTIIATTNAGAVDSTSFSVDVRPFNAPPRFTPLRNMRIRVGQEFTLPIQARDPDGANQTLIRYVGVDLPQGATVNEKTGLFRWTPSARQVGNHEIQIIATDQYGSAASASITITVDEDIEQ